MSQGETQQNTKRRRVSTKFRKEKKVFYRYGDFEKKVFDEYKFTHDLDDIPVTKILAGIIKEYHEMKTIQKFCIEDPDLAIKIRKEKEKQLWMDLLFDYCDMREIEAIKKACDDILEIKNK